MNICSICSGETISEPFDFREPIVCEECRYRCKTCGNRTMGGGHNEYCEDCKKKQKEVEVEKRTITIIDKTKVSGLEMSHSHYKELNSRVIDDNGNSISGTAGLNYMKSKGDTYASRLKDYYK